MLGSRDSHSSLELLAGVVMISFSAVFVKLALVGPSAAAFYRMTFGGILLLAITHFSRSKMWVGWKPFSYAVLSGILFTGDLVFWHRSIHYVGPGLSTILANFQVFFVTAAAIIFLKERPHWRAILAIPLALLGLVLLVGKQWTQLGESYHLGVVYGLVTAMFYASFVLCLRKLQHLPGTPTPIVSITISTLTTAVLSGMIVWITGESFVIEDLPSAAWLVLYGACGQVLGWVFITRSIKHLPAARVSLTLLQQPALSFLWDVLFFRRQTFFIEIVGVIVALIAIYLGTWYGQSKSRTHKT